MAVDQTWTDPSTSGAIDLATDDPITETVWDKVLSNLKAIAGTAGPPNTQATRGIFPVVGYVMGALGHDRHIESGTHVFGGSGTSAKTFTNAYASAPNVIACGSDNGTNNAYVSSPSTTGFTLGAAGAMTTWWIAEGTDV